MPASAKRRADEAADERVGRARGQPAPPGEQVPERRRQHAGADHGDRLARRDGRRSRRSCRRPRCRPGARPSMLKTAARTIACPGRAPRVATRVAIALAASWKPFVSAKAMQKAIASPSSTRQSSTPAGCHLASGGAPSRAIRDRPDLQWHGLRAGRRSSLGVRGFGHESSPFVADAALLSRLEGRAAE